MARTIAEIESQIIKEKNSQPSLSGLNSPSQVAIFRTWIFIQAVAISLLEQVIDVFKDDFENKVSKSVAGTPKWIQDKVLKFQYSATNPQITKLIDFIPSYNVIDASLRIITRCSVKTNALNQVLVKVAKNNPPEQLSTIELNSLTGYLNQGGNGTLSGAGTGIGFAGINTIVQSFSADKIFIKANIKYDGQYSTVIKENVINAINVYLSAIDFSGEFKTLLLVDAIQKVSGVLDISISDIAFRANDTPFAASPIYIIKDKTELSTSLNLFSGYLIGETTASNTLSDTITYTPI
jgi:hypothetical protein